MVHDTEAAGMLWGGGVRGDLNGNSMLDTRRQRGLAAFSLVELDPQSRPVSLPLGSLTLACHCQKRERASKRVTSSSFFFFRGRGLLFHVPRFTVRRAFSLSFLADGARARDGIVSVPVCTLYHKKCWKLNTRSLVLSGDLPRICLFGSLAMFRLSFFISA